MPSAGHHYFATWQAEHGEQIAAIGYGTFGPCDPHPQSPTYGWVTKTPKPGWTDTDVVGPLKAAFGIPIGFDTDVNGAALGEHLWGAAQDVDTFVYLTIGTGIGGGIIVNGRILHGLIHPEAGHVAMRRDPTVDPYPGRCPFHGDCLEGLAAGPAIGERWALPAAELGPEHPAWDLEAHYLAEACRNLVCTLSPQRIVLGGGVMEQLHLFPRIRTRTVEMLNGYVQAPEILERIDEFIVPPGLGNRAGVSGCIALGQLALAAAT
ncbi:MAG TPA: ROK family protein [Candidatus Limnocylindrales bacterium]|nr:ROK family protein [Candidatus Limnocylindrales bacterium]